MSRLPWRRRPIRRDRTARESASARERKDLPSPHIATVSIHLPSHLSTLPQSLLAVDEPLRLHAVSASVLSSLWGFSASDFRSKLTTLR